MKIRVKIFGTLRQSFSDYVPEHGLEIEIADEAKVQDLLTHLEIPESSTPIVAINSCLAKIDDELMDGAQVNIIQRAIGG